MRIEEFVSIFGDTFFTGVPDSQLKALCDYLMDTVGLDPKRHVIAANEGNCAALAAGYHLATGRTPVVYMQNSGQGNVVNPIASLLSDRVYGIPVLFVVGWRGQPGVHDEPQHVHQGAVTLRLFEDLDIPTFVIDADTTADALRRQMDDWAGWLAGGHQAALIVGKGGLQYSGKTVYRNDFQMTREQAIEHIIAATESDPVISTTGKASRELFELRERHRQGHRWDFLTVGSMGHSSSIALGMALQKPAQRVWCLDGDGAALMHMGAMAVIGAYKPSNLIHVVLNNQAHETVGGMPTVAGKIDLPGIARACGYPWAASVDAPDALERALEEAKGRGELCLLEVKCALGARADLGRPTTSPQENKRGFMACFAAAE